MRFHFWLPHGPPAAEVSRWDPDLEPGRFASGVGHNLVELYKRLEALGMDVSAGADVPRDTGLLVVFIKSAFEKRPPRQWSLRAALRAVQQVRGRFVLIRSDAPIEWRFPVRPVAEYVPTQAMVEEIWQHWLPPLPQRGLVPRRPERRGRIRTLAWKGNPPSVHPDLLTSGWREALVARSLGWLLDMPEHTDGADQSWHDFSELDAVLCMRTPAHTERFGRAKPPTRLINAWVAGCIPFADREVGYLELGTDAEDTVFVESPWECLEAIDRLNADPEALARLEDGARLQSVAFSAERTIDRWRDALLSAAEESGAGERHILRSAEILGHRAAVSSGLVLDPLRRRAGRARSRVRSSLERVRRAEQP